MNRDFRVGQSNELIKGERIYDLHNCFDFDGLDVSEDGELRLNFKPNTTHGGGYSSVLVFAQGVDRVAVSPDFGPTTVKDLEEIGYKSPSDEDDNWLLSQKQATLADDLFFRFNGGHYVRFHSRRASLIETPTISDSPPS
jgi:hypothetical protein